MSALNHFELHAEDEEIRQYLIGVDKLRQECESRGDYIRAQECVNRMREVSLRQAKRLESLTKLVSADAKVEMTEDHRIEVMSFNRMWEEKFREYNDRSDEVLANLKQSHLNDYTNQEGQLKLELMNKRPRFSRTVMDLRTFLEKSVQSRKYLEAEEAKRSLVVMEEKEMAESNRNLSLTFDRKSEAMKKQYINELRAVEQKIKRGSDELTKQREVDLTKLLMRHQNAIGDLDMNTKLHISTTKKCLEKKVTVLANDPAKTSADFRAVTQAIRAPATTRRVGQNNMHTSQGSTRNGATDDNAQDRYLW